MRPLAKRQADPAPDPQLDVIVDGGALVIHDVIDAPDSQHAVTIVTGDGHWVVATEGQYGDIRRIVLERI
jgi:hypothetical protein